MLYSASNNAFYDSKINKMIPDDAIEITEEEHAAILYAINQDDKEAYIEDGVIKLRPRPAVVYTLDQILELRAICYKREADPLKNEAEYDAMVNGGEPDYTAWLAKVSEIKERYPKLEQG